MSAAKPSSDQGDLMLWIAGGAIAAVGTAWLLITQPWKGGADEQEITLALAPTFSAATSPALTAEAEAVADDAAASEGALDNPLRMAQLAYEAGMLIEPDEYSAWTLFSRVLKAEPDNAAAREGLTKVADDLVHRGETALDQGRFDDARATVERIRSSLPNHAGAKTLAQKIWPQAAGNPGRLGAASARGRGRACRARRAGASSDACRNRRSTPLSRRATRSRRRWPKAGF